MNALPRQIRLTLAACGALLSVAIFPPDANPETRVRWKMQSAFSSNLGALGTSGVRLSERIEEMSRGNFQIQFHEPSVLVPNLEAFDAVSMGSVDAAWTTPSYHTGKLGNAISFFTFPPFGPHTGEYLAWKLYGGAKQLQEDLYASHGVTAVDSLCVRSNALARYAGDNGSLDEFRGPKMHSFGLHSRVMQKMGLSTQILRRMDAFSVLEENAIDATEFSVPMTSVSPGFSEFGINTDSSWWNLGLSCSELLMNKERYDALPDSYRGMLLAAAAEPIVYAHLNERVNNPHSMLNAWERWSRDGLAAPDDVYREAIKEISSEDEEFRKIAEDFLGFRETYSLWAEAQERAGANRPEDILGAQPRFDEHYWNGTGSWRVDKSSRLYAQGADPEDIQSYRELSRMIVGLERGSQEPDRVSESLSATAESGNAWAQVEYGAFLENQGNGDAAFQWYRRAAEQDDLDGIVHLAGAYRGGIGTEPDLIKARALFARAADQGFAPGQTELAQMLLKGEGGPRDLIGSVQLLELASSQDYAPALFLSSELYASGLGVVRDLLVAYRRLRRAAEQGLVAAIEKESLRLFQYCDANVDSCLKVPIIYVTDRQDTGDLRPDFRFANMREELPEGHDDLAPILHFGVLSVTVLVNSEAYVEQLSRWNRAWRRIRGYLNLSDSHDDAVLHSIEPTTEHRFREVLRNEIGTRPPSRAMFFLHGYNNSFSFAARRFAEFASRVGFDGGLVMFSWPSHNRVEWYVEDSDQVQLSCPSLKYVLDGIRREVPDARIDAIVHSMGARLLFDNLTAGISGLCERSAPEFANIILAAPDIRKDRFLSGLSLFELHAGRVTLYASSEDTALFVSSAIPRANTPMLGQGGRDLTVHEGMDTLDASDIEPTDDDATGHAYVFVNDIVIRDVRELLMLDRAPNSRSCLAPRRQGGLTYWVFESGAEC